MQECVWKFEGPKGYGFKFILTNFDERNTDLLVTNSTDYTITDGHHTHRRQVFYNGDNILIVYYQGKTICNSSAIDYLFEAQVTIVKNEWTEIDADCGLTENGSTIFWSTKNPNSIGYLNNAQCSYNFTVKPDTQIVATISKLRVECNVDILEYKDYDENEWIPIELPGSTHVFRYNQKRKNIFPIIWRFKSDGSIQNYGFKVQFETINPKIERVVLTLEKPTFAIEMVYVKENTIISVELSKELVTKSDKLEMYASFEVGNILTDILLVDNENMTKIASNIVDLFYGDYSKYASNYISPTNALTIYKPVKCPIDYAILFFRAAHTSNCLFKKTIYNIGSTRPQINLDNIIAMYALSSGTCELIFLNQPLAMKGLKEFYIHGHSKKPVIMYSGLEDKVHILNFSKTETKPWKKIYLGAMFYTVLIPQDSSLLVKTFEIYNLPRCTFGNDPFCSFIDTPYFGNPNTYKYQKKQIGFYIILCNPVIFTIQNFDVSKNGRLWFEANNNVTIDITAVGQKEIFDHTNLSIYFYEYDLGHIGARIYVTNAS